MMFFYRFLYVFIWPLFRLLFHPKVRGRENIPKSGAIIFAGNHKSNLDCVLLATCLWRQVHFMAKDELFRGAAGGFFRALGTIPVNRRIRDASSVASMIPFPSFSIRSLANSTIRIAFLADKPIVVKSPTWK